MILIILNNFVSFHMILTSESVSKSRPYTYMYFKNPRKINSNGVLIKFPKIEYHLYVNYIKLYTVLASS